ncbi:MAG TPA: alkaline shock response membrane anchor protein AmaP [Clostridiaceae bacterium]|nr:alkaline shock response membrane anchor protein AmaP [Clostridiaceae bacterium]
MKILEKFVLILYSFLVLVISVVLCLVIFKIIDIETINNCIKYMLEDSTILITVLASSIVCILLSIRCLFFRKRKEIKKSDATDILLENESGRLLISKRAIENAVRNVVNNAVKDTKDCKVIVDIDPANYLSVYVSILLNNNLKIRDMTLDLQLKIKSQIKDDFDLDVKQVNIKIDSVEEKENEKKESKKIVEKNETIIESQKS